MEFEKMSVGKTTLIISLAAFLTLSYQAAFALQTSPAPEGDPMKVAQKVIWDNFDKADCPKIVEAERVHDGSIAAKCSNKERFRIFVVNELNQPVAMRCSAAEKFGFSGC
jgi:hypothetical protein